MDRSFIVDAIHRDHTRVVTVMQTHIRPAICRSLWAVVFAAGLALMATANRGWAQDAPAADPDAAALDAMADDKPAAAEPAADEPALDDPAMDAAADEPAGDEPAADEMDADAIDSGDEDEPDKKKPKAKPRAKKPVFQLSDEDTKLPLEPAVQAVLESNPQTPFELLRAIDILADLDQAALAKPLVDELATRQLEPEDKAALVKQLGSARLLKLARHAELGVALAPVIDDWLRVADEVRRDPARLADVASQLTDPSERVRSQAAYELIRAGNAAVAPLVAVLADPKRAEQHGAAKELLVHLGDLAVAPLLGVLESPNAALKVQVIEVLGRLGDPVAVPQLLGALVSASGSPALHTAAEQALRRIQGGSPDVHTALATLEKSVRRALDQSRVEGDASAEPTEVWHWNASKHQCMPIRYDATGAALAKAVRLARALYLADPQNAIRCRLYLAAMLQAAKFRGGLDKPLPSGERTAYAVAAHYGPELLDDLLDETMTLGYIPAATAAAQILGDVGHASMLTRGAAEPSALARGAAHADRRLRFAATNAILKLNPNQPFAGSNHVASALGFFARSYGVPRALVVHPLSDQAQQMAGLLNALGYETDIATNGRAAFELAVNSPDYELMLVHSTIDRPRVDDLVAQFRRDRRTSLVPIGLIAPEDDLQRVDLFARAIPRTDALLQPRTDDEMKLTVDRVLSRAGRFRVTATERREQAIAALDWLVALSQQPNRVFDMLDQESVLTAALFVPELNGRAAAVLSQLPTATAQRSLLELANLGTQQAAAREAAAQAFTANVQTYGLRLTRDEIMQQYELYNANAGRDADTHAVLATVLDAIEQKGDAAGGP